MAYIFILRCKTCGQDVCTDEKTKQYTHVATLRRGVKIDHPVLEIVSERIDPKATKKEGS